MPDPALSEEKLPTEALLDMDMQQLMNITVTSAGKRHEKYYSTAAAVYVISNDDIRRSGAVSIPEALRLAPGVEVQQANANKFAVSIRGQNDTFSDKLLVMMDGRALYSPSFSGVWWLVHNYPLEDIDRIEVIRGPAGAVWGSNAVNGIINIITKNARKTQGLMVSGGVGTEEKGFGSLRYGWGGKQAHFRTYAMIENRDGGIYDPNEVHNANTWSLQRGVDTPDYRKFGQAGFRMDWDVSYLSQVALIGNIYNMNTGAFGYLASQPGVGLLPYTRDNSYSGQNLLLRTDHDIPYDMHVNTQLYYDHYSMDVAAFTEARNTFDAEVQLDLPQFYRQSLSVGGGYRLSRSDMTNSSVLRMADKTDQLYSLFIQDDIDIIRDKLKLTAGLKAEHNQYTGWELQPSLRTIYSEDSWSIWASASRTSRIPNMIDNGLELNVGAGAGFVAQITGDGRMKSEQVTAYETGVRLYPDDDLLIQITGFKMFYKGVNDVHNQKLNPAAWLPPTVSTPYFVIPIYLQNVLDGNVKGVEVDFTWQATPWAKLKGSFTHLKSRYFATPINDSETRSTAFSVSEQTPTNRYHIGLGIDPGYDIELDVNLFHWDAFRQDELTRVHAVKRYDRLDARIGWRPTKELELSLVAKNLLKATHKEDTADYLEGSTLQQQSYLLKATYRYK